MSDQLEEKAQYTSMSGCFMRVMWAMVGPTLVLVSSLLIIANKSPYGSFPDFVLMAGAFASVVARFLDPGLIDPDRNDGDIGKLSPKKYALWMLMASAIVLVIAHSVAPLLH
jgi:putative exporter of polyketide antibiotics